MYINTNISSIKTRFYLSGNQDELMKAQERLSSGMRINSAKDDAAGLAISSRMTTQIEGMSVAGRNAQDGISMLQTSEGGLSTVNNILQRMRELAVQANNGTNGASDVQALQNEIDALVSEVANISGSLDFNNIDLYAGDGTPGSNVAQTITLHIGQGATETMTVLLGQMDTITLGLNNAAGQALDLTTSASAAIAAIDTALQKVSDERAALGATMNRLEFTIDNLNTTSTNMSAARSRIEDADMAMETSNLTKQRILSQSSLAMLSQANENPSMVLSLLQN